MKVIAVDMDDTLSRYDDWRGVGHFGPPIARVLLRLRAEKSKGARVIIHTTRINGSARFPMAWQKRMIERWLKHYDVPYDSIWTGRGKPVADEYWDDKAYRP